MVITHLNQPFLRTHIMTDKANRNHKANMKNKNVGTNGNNIANAKTNGNHGKQLNKNRKK